MTDATVQDCDISVHVNRSPFYGGKLSPGKCVASVYSSFGNGFGQHVQCSNKSRFEYNGHPYCKMHNPPDVARKRAVREAEHRARAETSTAKWKAELDDRALKDRCVAAIRQIAAGHNDPRALAVEALSPSDPTRKET